MSIYCVGIEFQVRHQSQVADSVEVMKLICRRGDSNPHELPHTPLKRARLPVPPLRHEVSLEGCGHYSRISFQENGTTTYSQPVMRLVLPGFVASVLESVSLLPSARFQVATTKQIASHSGSASPTRARST